MTIQKEDWEKCKICNCNLKDMVKKYGGSGVYKSQCFKKHIESEHGLSLNDYFENRPLCSCGICGKVLSVVIDGSKIRYKKLECGRHEGTILWSEKAKTSRVGKNNPMHGKKPWNKDHTKLTHSSLKSNSDKNTGKIVSEETKKKQSESAKKRIVHGHTGKPHSEETKEFLKQNTLRLIKNGHFKQNETLPSKTFEDLLIKLNIKYEKEKLVSYWSFDFYLIDYNIYIEIDGDYWHSNPKIYKNGPKTSTQKRNAIRDIKKNEFCKNNNLILFRFWESDVLGDIECIQQKLLSVIMLEKNQQWI